MIDWVRRRRFLIDRLQLKLLGINIAYLSAIIFMFLAAIFAPTIYEVLGKTSVERSAESAAEFLSLHKRVWPAVPFAVLLFSLHSMVVSHRVAGPLYRFRKVFGSVQEGDLSIRAIIRTKDYLHREAKTLNDMIDGLASQVGRIKRHSQASRVAYRELEDALGAAPPALEEALRRLETQLAGLDDCIECFILPGAAAEESAVPADDADSERVVSENSIEAVSAQFHSDSRPG